MRLERANVENYRSIKDTGLFDVAHDKTILVGPNEAGKTAILRALEHLGPGPLVKPFEALRDYPRSRYDQFRASGADPDTIKVASATFTLDPEDQAAVEQIAPAFKDCKYQQWVSLGNKRTHGLVDAPPLPTVGAQKDSLRRLAVHADARVPAPAEGAEPAAKPTDQLNGVLAGLRDSQTFVADKAAELLGWLDATAPYVDENNTDEVARLASLRETVNSIGGRDEVLAELHRRSPVLVYFSIYTRVRPVLHLKHLADAEDAGAIDPGDPYNFGNYCLLKLLRFTARELSDLGSATEPPANDKEAFEEYRKKLDERSVVLGAASLRLTQEIKKVWEPDENEGGSDYTIRITADQQYLKVGVEDSLGVEVELDQRSEGFQWLVSFFIVFFAQAADQLKGAILLLDEPGLSLHGLKQREFRKTLSRLAEDNQLIFTTHSPFLVGPDELDIVRVVEMTDRNVGTKVHTQVMADDPASLLPLQEALGYDLAQSLFAQQRNLVLEGLTDYWYVDATASLLRADGGADLKENIALVPAGSAGKVVYFATILHAQKLKVAALLDSDAAGDQAATQETLLHTLGNKGILRTKDSYTGGVTKPEIEDLLRETLVKVGKDDLGWDVTDVAAAQPARPIADIFSDNISGFSKYKLAKAYLRWTRDHAASDLAADERTAFEDLIDRANRALK
jgi:hypothetical protein